MRNKSKNLRYSHVFLTKGTVSSFLPLIFFSFINISCASLITGKKQEIIVYSTPSGAQAQIGDELKATPAIFVINRAKKSCSVTVKKIGYRYVTINLERGTNGWVWLNVLNGGLGLIIDFFTGSAVKFVPERIYVNFETQDVGDAHIKDKNALFLELEE